jgi:hypothetical protein
LSAGDVIITFLAPADICLSADLPHVSITMSTLRSFHGSLQTSFSWKYNILFPSKSSDPSVQLTLPLYVPCSGSCTKNGISESGLPLLFMAITSISSLLSCMIFNNPYRYVQIR